MFRYHRPYDQALAYVANGVYMSSLLKEVQYRRLLQTQQSSIDYTKAVRKLY
jgi:hypothetical protein